jgi:hypothetical protein
VARNGATGIVPLLASSSPWINSRGQRQDIGVGQFVSDGARLFGTVAPMLRIVNGNLRHTYPADCFLYGGGIGFARVAQSLEEVCSEAYQRPTITRALRAGAAADLPVVQANKFELVINVHKQQLRLHLPATATPHRTVITDRPATTGGLEGARRVGLGHQTAALVLVIKLKQSHPKRRGILRVGLDLCLVLRADAVS